MFGITGKTDKELFPSYYPEINDERTSTIFWDDFSIADAFGEKGIRDTFDRAFESWKSNCKYLTELTVVLNHKCWFWHSRGNERLSRLYADLYEKSKDYGYDNLKGDELNFFWKVLD